MWGWYKSVTNRPLPPARISIAKIMEERVSLYMCVPTPWGRGYPGGDRSIYHSQLCTPGRQNCGVSQSSPPPQASRAYANTGGAFTGVDYRGDVGLGPISRELGVVSEPSTYYVQGWHPAYLMHMLDICSLSERETDNR